MRSKLIFISLLLLTTSFMFGCQTNKLYYSVPKDIDLTDIINGSVKNVEQEQIYGYMAMPDNPKGKIPAVVIMHASGGVFRWREHKVAELLNEAGIAAFIPCSFSARGFRKTKSTRETGTTFGMRVADAYSALNFLSKQPGIDPNRIGIMGYSSGGIASFLSHDEKIRRKMVDEELKFAAHINVYAPSILVFKENEPTNAPMLFLIGEKDNTSPSDKMLALVKKIERAGGNVQSIVYPEAHHVFDSPSGVKTFNAENDGNCQFQILNNGNLFDSATGEEFPESELYSDDNKHIAPCKSNTVSFGRNNFAAQQYKKDIVQFFKETLKP